MAHIDSTNPSSPPSAFTGNPPVAVVLGPCGVCRKRLAVHGPDVIVAVADLKDPTVILWKPLKDVLPDYWMTAFADEIDAAWTA